jgi:hypothetical protein
MSALAGVFQVGNRNLGRVALTSALGLAIFTALSISAIVRGQTPPRPTPAVAAAAQPATPDEAAKVLDLRTFPRLEGAKPASLQTLGMLMYEAPGKPQAAMEFLRRELTKRGFKELAGGYASAETQSAHFTKSGYTVAVSASQYGGDPAKAGLTSIRLVNGGNVDLAKLPVPPGVKPFHPQPTEASYTTTAPVAETAAACRKLLLAAGWEPFGQSGQNPNQPEMAMEWYKRNGIKLQSWVMKTPADGGKTLIRYSTELLSADLPYPPDTADPRYTDSQKTLRYDSPLEQTDAIIAFYQERLPKMGWKATTDHPIVDDQKRTQFLIFRNAAKEMLSLDLTEFSKIIRVELRHQTEAEVAESERLAKLHIEKEKAAQAERNKKFDVSLPLPAPARALEKLKENVLEFALATGSGPAALEAYRAHFVKEGWTEEDGTELGKNTGELELKKGNLELRFSYFDSGFTDAEIKVSGSSNVVLKPASGKLVMGKPMPDKPAPGNAKAGTKPTTPKFPGLPDLPPGVEIPDDVKALLEKALQDAGQKP